MGRKSLLTDKRPYAIQKQYAGPSQAGGINPISTRGGAHYPHPVLRAPPDFQTLRRTSYVSILEKQRTAQHVKKF